MNQILQTPVTWALLLFGGLAWGTAWAQDQTQISSTVTEFGDAGAMSRSHVIETRRQEDGRTVETRRVEVPSINGGYEPISDSERETIQVDANTVRVVERWFSSWAGERQLFQVSEEESVAPSRTGARA